MKRSTSLMFMDVGKIILNCVLALSTVALLFLYGINAKKITDLKKEIEILEKEQKQYVEENKKLVSEISQLSNPERIERIATEELGMHKADSTDILRVEMSGGSNNE